MDWYQLVVPDAGVYTGPGVSSAIAANRISFWAEVSFGLDFLILREAYMVLGMIRTLPPPENQHVASRISKHVLHSRFTNGPESQIFLLGGRS